jgi:aminopeptidase N
VRRLVLLLAACHGTAATPDAPVVPTAPTANADREVIDTTLAFDVTALTATATVTLGPSSAPGGSLEVGDLMIDTVKVAGADLPFAIHPTTVGNMGGELDLGLPASDQPTPIDIAYHYKTHESFEGASMYGFTLLWPYYCGNVFPCHSDPADGTTFSLNVTGVPTGKLAVFPATIPSEAPAYQIAWSIDAYTELPLGTTTAGTNVSVWYRTGELTKAMTGTAHLVAAFDWLEQTLGAYRFGDHVGSVSVAWPRGAFGGMEHHPRWHIASAALGDEVTNVHESSHGWFGDGIRIACWEDFVLSEGTVSYLAARALDVVAPTVGAAAWNTYAGELATLPGTDPVWPQSCGTVDVLKGNLFTNAPYMRGAFFYRAVAQKVGATQLDQALAAFYQAHGGGAAHMSDMLATIKTVTGYDPTACAQAWLQDTTIPAVGACP